MKHKETAVPPSSISIQRQSDKQTLTAKYAPKPIHDQQRKKGERNALTPGLLQETIIARQ